MHGEEQTLGEVVERLIFIKRNYGIEDRGDLDAINNACNILSNKFNRLDTVNKVLDSKEE